jgi:hypothetical protein
MLLPALFTYCIAIRCYNSLEEFKSIILFAVPLVASFLFNIVAYSKRPSTKGSQFWPMFFVSVAVTIGGVGVISVAANSFPRYFAELIGSEAQGGSEANDQRFERIRPLVKLLFAEGNPAGVKAALTVKGVVSNYLRLPLVEVSEPLYGQIEEAIREGGFE